MVINNAKKVEIKRLALVLAGQHLGIKDPPEVDMWARAAVEAAKKIAPLSTFHKVPHSVSACISLDHNPQVESTTAQSLWHREVVFGLS